MKRVPLILALALAACLVSGCDFFRALAGRPLSGEIASRRALIGQARERTAARADSLEQARKDSIAISERARADSLHAIDTLVTIGKYHRASSYRNIPASRLRSRYGVVVGVFSTDANANRMLARYGDEGLEGYVLHYRSSLMAAVVCPCDKVTDALAAYRRVRALPFSSKETWVIVNE